MTSPEDDGLEEALRRALSDAASEVEPGSEGLDKIRTRIAGRPPRPWLLSVLFGAAERVRNWTWRGHWAQPGWLSRLAEARWPRLRQGRFPAWGSWSFRLAAVFAAIAVIASVTMGVRPFRNAILQASTASHGGGSGSQTIAGTEGSGTRSAEGGTGLSSASPAPSGAGSTGSAPGASRTPDAAQSPSPAAKCKTSALPVVTSTEPTLTDQPSESASPAIATPSPVISTQSSAQPVYTKSSALTCPVAAPTQSPTPTPSASASTPAATGSDPTDSDSTSSDSTSSDSTSGDPTPTSDPTPPSDGQPSASGPPSRQWLYRHPREPSPRFHRR